MSLKWQSAPVRRKAKQCRILTRKAVRPRLELLEDRTLLSTVSWVGGSGDWATGSNWSNGVGPGTNDDAVIDVAGITVTHSSGSHTVKSLTASDAVILSGGTLSVTGTLSDSSALTLTGGTLANATVQ